MSSTLWKPNGIGRGSVGRFAVSSIVLSLAASNSAAQQKQLLRRDSKDDVAFLAPGGEATITFKNEEARTRRTEAGGYETPPGDLWNSTSSSSAFIQVNETQARIDAVVDYLTSTGELYFEDRAAYDAIDNLNHCGGPDDPSFRAFIISLPRWRWKLERFLTQCYDRVEVPGVASSSSFEDMREDNQTALAETKNRYEDQPGAGAVDPRRETPHAGQHGVVATKIGQQEAATTGKKVEQKAKTSEAAFMLNMPMKLKVWPGFMYRDRIAEVKTHFIQELGVVDPALLDVEGWDGNLGCGMAHVALADYLVNLDSTSTSTSPASAKPASSLYSQSADEVDKNASSETTGVATSLSTTPPPSFTLVLEDSAVADPHSFGKVCTLLKRMHSPEEVDFALLSVLRPLADGPDLLRGGVDDVQKLVGEQTTSSSTTQITALAGGVGPRVSAMEEVQQLDIHGSLRRWFPSSNVTLGADENEELQKHGTLKEVPKHDIAEGVPNVWTSALMYNDRKIKIAAPFFGRTTTTATGGDHRVVDPKTATSGSETQTLQELVPVGASHLLNCLRQIPWGSTPRTRLDELRHKEKWTNIDRWLTLQCYAGAQSTEFRAYVYDGNDIFRHAETPGKDARDTINQGRSSSSSSTAT
ncbi:unnamed protein product [Amoebophrya sp. A120]|nr:unnamed protein product [Amoebophrya sp. A120]|eukprot:GSA120T00013087001.1